MCLTLFDSAERSNLDAAAQAEAIFPYLNRTARKPMDIVREKLESWFVDFPADGQTELRARFRSKNDEDHLSAFFELYCHALLIAQGYRAEVHPTSCSAKADTRPDFLVFKSDEPIFYFEATSAHESKKEIAVKSRRAQLHDAVNRIDLPGYFIGMAIRSEGAASLRSEPVRKFLVTQAREKRCGKYSAAVTRHEFRAGGWRIEFSLHPLAKSEPKPERPIGLVSSPATFTQCETSILKTLKKKSGKYGDLPLPYVIAVNCTDHLSDQEDIYESLFGKQVHTLYRDSDVAVPTGWDGNGFWLGPNGYQNSRVSAVLVATQLLPWTIGSAQPYLWLNPYPKRKFDSSWWGLSQRVPNDDSGELETLEKVTACTLLGTGTISDAIRK